ncbi:hypothetical protein R1sor_001981 [Riccia sorocarpa]|uniref:Reverse transcriptase zinc-binding domain-containing protein n=1 Tax=Riccia sorocarpa TaxID=122646 RepID=A0ABD3H3F9_9MARC
MAWRGMFFTRLDSHLSQLRVLSVSSPVIKGVPSVTLPYLPEMDSPKFVSQIWPTWIELGCKCNRGPPSATDPIPPCPPGPTDIAIEEFQRLNQGPMAIQDSPSSREAAWRENTDLHPVSFVQLLNQQLLGAYEANQREGIQHMEEEVQSSRSVGRWAAFELLTGSDVHQKNRRHSYDNCFMEHWRTKIQATEFLANKAPGIDAFTAESLRLIWHAYQLSCFQFVNAFWLSLLLPKLVSVHQAGFIRGGSTFDNAFLLQLVHEQLTRSRNAAAFVKIDLAKAFDRLNSRYLWMVLERVGCGIPFTRLVQGLMIGAQAAVQLGVRFHSLSIWIMAYGKNQVENRLNRLWRLDWSQETWTRWWRIAFSSWFLPRDHTWLWRIAFQAFYAGKRTQYTNHPDTKCHACEADPETVVHLLFTCRSCQAVWSQWLE